MKNKNPENLSKIANLEKGVLAVNKPTGKTSFSLIHALRKLTKIQKIGHAGTLDPFASGVMILLIGREYTRKSQEYMQDDKEYHTIFQLGIETDSYDCTGKQLATSDKIPTKTEIDEILQKHFQGTVEQIPPMFSAKKVAGKKLYLLARQGKEIERKAATISLKTTLLSYDYPYLTLSITCSKGTYIRSIAHDLGIMLQTGAHVLQLTRTRSGSYTIDECIDGNLLFA